MGVPRRETNAARLKMPTMTALGRPVPASHAGTTKATSKHAEKATSPSFGTGERSPRQYDHTTRPRAQTAALAAAHVTSSPYRRSTTTNTNHGSMSAYASASTSPPDPLLKAAIEYSLLQCSPAVPGNDGSQSGGTSMQSSTKAPGVRE